MRAIPTRVLSWFEANTERIGVAGGVLLVAGYIGRQAERQGSAELEAAAPAQEWAYNVDDEEYLAHEARARHERDQRRPSARRSPVPLPCFAGQAEEGDDTHGVRRRVEVPGCRLVIQSLLRGPSGDMPGGAGDPFSVAPSSSVLHHQGLRQGHAHQLRRDRFLVVDGLLGPDELRQLSAELRHPTVRERLGASPNEAASAGRRVEAAGRDGVRSDRLLFLGAAHRSAAQGSLPALTHAERLLRSLGACLEGCGFDGFDGAAPGPM